MRVSIPAMRQARIGWLGLGEMGRRMARRLEHQGHRVVVWNRSPKRAAGFERIAATPAEAALGADAVITMVTDAEALDEVTSALPRDTLLVDMSTSGPRGARLIGERFRRAVDAPVGGSLSEAESGALAIYAGGEPGIVEEVEPVLAGLGTVHRMGPLGSGQAIKVIGNLLMVTNVAVLGEGLRMAGQAGLDPDTALAALAAGPGASRAIGAKGAAIVERRFGPPARFTLTLAHKDVRLALEMGGGAYAALAERLLDEAERAGRGAQDYSAVAAEG
jgi:3-hydroxyisobutyrate dehydrogenase-like beta-hydroxyacid dehydrogenase